MKGNEAERKRKSYIQDILAVYHEAMRQILKPLEAAALEYVNVVFSQVI
jgi:hypothetical protein